MNADPVLFEIEQDGPTLVMSPLSNLSELELTGWDQAIRDVMDQLESRGFQNIVLDFTGTDYYGSTALGFFITLWKRVRQVDGQMVFCNISAHERDVLKSTRLDTLWPVCATRDEALRLIRSE